MLPSQLDRASGKTGKIQYFGIVMSGVNDSQYCSAFYFEIETICINVYSLAQVNDIRARS